MEFWVGSRDAGTLRSAKRKPSAAIGAARLRTLPRPRLQTDRDGGFNCMRIVWMRRNWTAGLALAGDQHGSNDCCRRCLVERGLPEKVLAEKAALAGSPMPVNCLDK